MRPNTVDFRERPSGRATWNAALSTLLVSLGAGLSVANAVMVSAGGAVA